MIFYTLGLIGCFLGGFYFKSHLGCEQECADCTYKNRCRYCIYD